MDASCTGKHSPSTVERLAAGMLGIALNQDAVFVILLPDPDVLTSLLLQ
jgi:hypothetical protein